MSRFEFYDEIKATFSRLKISFDDYLKNYENFLSVFEKETDGDELIFVTAELDLFEEIEHYLILRGEGMDSDNSYQTFGFEKRYKAYLYYIDEAWKNAANTFLNSLERKIHLLTERKIELGSKPIQNTLNQRLLLIKYLDRSKRFKLTQLHPDNTGQSQILKFLMNAGYQNVRSGLGRNIDSLINPKDLNVLLNLLKPFELYFADVILDIEKDLAKISKIQ